MSNLLQVPIRAVILPNFLAPLIVNQVIEISPKDVYWCLSRYDKDIDKVILFVDSNQYVTDWSLEEYKQIYEQYKDLDITNPLKNVLADCQKDSKSIHDTLLLLQIVGVALRLVDRDISISLSVIHSSHNTTTTLSPNSPQDLGLLSKCLNIQLAKLIDTNISILTEMGVETEGGNASNMVYSNVVGEA